MSKIGEAGIQTRLKKQRLQHTESESAMEEEQQIITEKIQQTEKQESIQQPGKTILDII